MVYEVRKQSMPWMEDHSKDTHIRWKIKWRVEYLGALGIVGETAAYSKIRLPRKDWNRLVSFRVSFRARVRVSG